MLMISLPVAAIAIIAVLVCCVVVLSVFLAIEMRRSRRRGVSEVPDVVYPPTDLHIRPPPLGKATDFPKKIWIFWENKDKGSSLPDIVQRCVDLAQKMNPGYVITVLNSDNFTGYVDDEDKQVPRVFRDSLPAKSDYIRICVLRKNGGIWMDASVICQKPFDDWLFDHAQGCEYIGVYNHTFTSKEMLNVAPIPESWFFACLPGSDFMNAWYNEMKEVDMAGGPAKYIDRVRASGYTTQLMQAENRWTWDDVLPYLFVYVAFTVALQKNPGRFNMLLRVAERTGYVYLDDDPADPVRGVDRVMAHEFDDQPIIKLHNGTRAIMSRRDYRAFFDSMARKAPSGG